MQSFLLLLPDFALIAVGAVLRRFFGLGDGFWPGVEKLVYFVLFPALLFQALARSSVDVGAMGPLLAVGLLTMAGGLLLGLAGRRLIGLDAIAFASRLQCAYRFNTYIGIAVAGKLAGAAGVATMGALCGAMVPFANMAAVAMLARHGQGRLAYALTPRFAPTSSEAQLAMAGRLLASRDGLYMQTHVAENRDEVRWVAELFPEARSYLDVYHRAGLLGERSVLAHGIWLDDEDRALLAAPGRRSPTAPAATCSWAAACSTGTPPAAPACRCRWPPTWAAAPACACRAPWPRPTRCRPCAAWCSRFGRAPTPN